MKKLILLTIIIVSGLIYYIKIDIDSLSNDRANLASLSTAQITYGEISSTLSGRGKVVPNRMVPVNSIINGQITEILVKEGQNVKKGQCLVKIDIESRFKFRIIDLQRKVLANNYEKEQLQNELTFQQKLYTKGLTAQIEIKKLKRKRKWAEMKEAALDKERQILGKRLGYSLTKSSLINDTLSDTSNGCIQADIAGTILQINKRVDDRVFSEGGFDGGTIMFIGDISTYHIDYKISEFDLDMITTGQQVEIIFDSMPEKLFHGKIENISSMAIYDLQGGRFIDTSKEMSQYNVKILITSDSTKLKPDLSCRILIKTSTRQHVLLAPISATFKENDDRQFVFIQKNGQYERRQIDVGIADINKIEVQSGLTADDIVYLEPMKIIEQNKIIAAAQSKTFIEKILH